MPAYDFLNTENGEITEHVMSWRDLDDFKLNNPHLKQQIGTPMIVSGTGDRVKTDGGFKEVLSKIGDAYKGSDVDQRYNGVDAKTNATKRIVKKHMDIQSKRK
jgi:hypothetical protein|tara:strand:+ start:129 stop:437 length:309 start_codon:yes stop_codon:yes gene_type:complete